MSPRNPKPHLSLAAQVNRLVERRLQVNDIDLAMKTLGQVNYYRLRGYFHVFLENKYKSEIPDQTKTDIFLPETTFENVMAIYNFDALLRRILRDALSEFELRLRTSIAYHAGNIDPLVHLNGEGSHDNFTKIPANGESEHSKWLSEYQGRFKSSAHEDFVKWHVEEFDGQLPIWAAVEILQFGQLVKLYGSFNQGTAYLISNDFGVDPKILKSWATSFNDLRNLAAHHSRIWNKTFVKTPKISGSGFPKEILHLQNCEEWRLRKLYTQLTVLAWIFSRDQSDKNRVLEIMSLLNDFPESEKLSLDQAGFPSNWRELFPWSAQS
jgi:abortive infection bacteriophage resistance protein